MTTATLESTSVHQYEIEWMLKTRPLEFSKKQLSLDYGEEDAKQMLSLFQGSFEKYLPCLSYHGVGTRFKRFYEWLQQKEKENALPSDAKEAFVQFANFLGRVTSYRALGITKKQYDFIVEKNTIWPSGRLQTDEETIKSIIQKFGIRRICTERLYYTGAMGFDPSLSLHDDGETATCIAQTFVKDFSTRQVFLMELSVPVIETIGYRILDVQVNDKEWFCYQGVWFDSTLESTERYCVYEIPFYKERLTKLTVFNSREDAWTYITPFAKRQEAKRNASLRQQLVK